MDLKSICHFGAGVSRDQKTSRYRSSQFQCQYLLHVVSKLPGQDPVSGTGRGMEQAALSGRRKGSKGDEGLSFQFPLGALDGW